MLVYLLFVSVSFLVSFFLSLCLLSSSSPFRKQLQYGWSIISCLSRSTVQSFLHRQKEILKATEVALLCCRVAININSVTMKWFHSWQSKGKWIILKQKDRKIFDWQWCQTVTRACRDEREKFGRWEDRQLERGKQGKEQQTKQANKSTVLAFAMWT